MSHIEELKKLQEESHLPEFAFNAVVKEVARDQWRKEIRNAYDSMPLSFKANNQITVESVEDMINALPDYIPQEIILEEVAEIKGRGWKDIARGKLRAFPSSSLGEYLNSLEQVFLDARVAPHVKQAIEREQKQEEVAKKKLTHLEKQDAKNGIEKRPQVFNSSTVAKEFRFDPNK